MTDAEAVGRGGCACRAREGRHAYRRSMTSPADPTGTSPLEGLPYAAPHLVRLDARATLSLPTGAADDIYSS